MPTKLKIEAAKGEIIEIGDSRCHVTSVRRGGVFGHEVKHCDDAGCAGRELYLADLKVPLSMSEIIESCLETAIWSSCDEDGEPLDERMGVDDISPEQREEIEEDCMGFCEANAEDLEASGLTAQQIGRCFWLTRNSHGTGFWDQGLGELGDRLSKAARAYGGIDIEPPFRSCLEED